MHTVRATKVTQCERCALQTVLPSLSEKKKIIPPSRDSLRQHRERANYQAATLKNSLNATINAPSPVGHGWHLKDGKVAVT